MTELSKWEYSGSIELTADLSRLEAEMHAGRVAAAERGYQHEPDAIEVSEAMPGPDGALISEQAAAEANLDFVPTRTRFVMTWNSQA